MTHLASAFGRKARKLGTISFRRRKSANSAFLEPKTYNFHGKRDESPVHANR